MRGLHSFVCASRAFLALVAVLAQLALPALHAPHAADACCCHAHECCAQGDEASRGLSVESSSRQGEGHDPGQCPMCRAIEAGRGFLAPSTAPLPGSQADLVRAPLPSRLHVARVPDLTTAPLRGPPSSSFA